MSEPAHVMDDTVLISEAYRDQNRRLHDSNPHYGTSGARMAELVRHHMKLLDSRSVLDYGCGKRTLEKALGLPIANYDPCIPGLDRRPAPCDIVVCSDVLEHIEPEFLDSVLDDLKRVTLKVGMFTACTEPAMKHLPDGRNAHLIVQGQDWWVPRIRARFHLESVHPLANEFLVIVRPLPASAA
jgi:hypothetical protein